MTTSGITNINAKLIHQHPDNPRKDLGDLTELSESIKKKGIMQNLTVIPGYWDENRAHHEEGYTLIIGHRRFAAGKMAGVTMYPCRIVEDMSYKDQVGTMLEENMQRIDLTPLEQAEGFQMMLDLGDTEEQIAEKTGFSRTTVHRRLEIAKLDRDLVKEKTDEKEKEEAEEKIQTLDTQVLLLIAMNGMMDDYIGDLVEYSGEYKEDTGKRYQECFKILMRFGWSYEREEADLVYGNHELYKKES